jgi:hypothetical protein
MEIQTSDDIEKYAGSDIVSRAETGDGRGSGVEDEGDVRVDDGIGSTPAERREMLWRLTGR